MLDASNNNLTGKFKTRGVLCTAAEELLDTHRGQGPLNRKAMDERNQEGALREILHQEYVDHLQRPVEKDLSNQGIGSTLQHIYTIEMG